MTDKPMHPQADRPGYFGKIPARGDFVSRSLPRVLTDPWEGCVREGMATAKDQYGKGWLDRFLTAPVWAFSIADDQFGARAWAGVVAPSVDKVGRYFPLMIAAPCQEPDTLDTPFYTAAIECLYAGLDPSGFDAEVWSASIAALPVPAIDQPPSSEPVTACNGQIRWRLFTPEALRGRELITRTLPSPEEFLFLFFMGRDEVRRDETISRGAVA